MNLRNLSRSGISSQLKELFGRSSLGLIEVVALVAALVFAGASLYYYFSKVQPLRSELSSLQDREKDIRLQIEKANTDEAKRQKQASNAETILVSLKNFDVYLKQDERGMTEIINEVDALGRKYGVLTGDSTYRVAEAEPLVDENGQPIQQKNGSQDETQKIYPVLGIDTNIVGEYPNLRKFLLELERSKQFLVINSLTFQGESDQVRRDAQKSGSQKLQLSSPEAIPVSLKIEMDTYFQSPYKKETTSKPIAQKKPEQATDDEQVKQKASTQKAQ
ncbi:MAG: GspMb/PilO family protein [Blastocatellia bacterium]